ncbi:tRNA-dihydrouridine synthase [Candidatus Woesebacteria bacterium]|nr:tRNA-dihydrouridine synthase [Candidatus Woesebacteria bacterium]MCD8546285.1 tRNA-dihydrouridine synthase [Candidatus Woesebacteria bacterium]
MFSGFWNDLPAQSIGLSPMDGVTDHPYRFIQKKYSNPDVMMTEFTSAEGVSRNALKLFRDFRFDETQRPIVAQIFGNEPRAFYITAVILCYLGFDGIDINMGCPAKSVRQHGSGAALILTPDLAQELVRQTRQGIHDFVNGLELESIPELKQKTRTMIMERHRGLPPEYQARREIPVSVKTRVGFDAPVIKDWIETLLEVEPAVISVHGRTLKQLYSGSANWDLIGQAAEVAKNTPTKVFGNGDVRTPEQAQEKFAHYGVDGILVGRATFGDPWLIGEMRRYRDSDWSADFEYREPSVENRINIAIEHSRIYAETYPNEHFLPMRKHLAWYIKGFPFASEYRVRLMMADSAEEVESVLEEFRGKLNTGTPNEAHQ